MTKLNEKDKSLIYVLYHEFGYKQQDIAKLMRISQATVALTSQKMKMKSEIEDLTAELEKARKYLEENRIQNKNNLQKPITFYDVDDSK